MEATAIKEDVWLDTHVLEYDNDEYVKDFCENSYPPREIPERNSQAWWNLLDYMRDCDVDDFWGNLKYSKYNRPCIITGNLGLWWGCPEVRPVLCSTLVEALEKCSDDMWDFRVTVKDGVIHAYGYHHDGTNCFEVRVINSKYVETIEEWFENESGSFPFFDNRFYDHIDCLY